jgi:hypothetical protein
VHLYGTFAMQVLSLLVHIFKQVALLTALSIDTAQL